MTSNPIAFVFIIIFSDLVFTFIAINYNPKREKMLSIILSSQINPLTIK